MAEFERKMPFALEAEQSVLGSILIDPEKFSEITDVLTANDFYVPEHAEIFNSMQELFIKSKDIDIVTLIDMLVSRGIYDKDNAAKYVRVIAETVPTSANLGDYAKIVKDKSTLRKLIDVAGEIIDDAYASHGEVRDIVEKAEASVFAVSQDKETRGFVKLSDAILQTYARLDSIVKNGDGATGAPTGYSALDNVLVGMGPGDLILIGARPGMGKTSFAMNIATNVAKNPTMHGPVCIFSLEMSAEQLASRLLSSEAMIESKKIRNGQMSQDEWGVLALKTSELSMCNILIDDTPGITVTGMKGKLRRLREKPSLIVVDYLQLMQGERHSDNRVLEVGDISRGLKLLAKELGAPIICCAQLSRGPESRTDKRPMLSDLRDSGAIEQDADVVIFLYRDEYYKADPAKQSEAECIFSKNRHGEVGTVKLGWIGMYTKFIELDSHREDDGHH